MNDHIGLALQYKDALEAVSRHSESNGLRANQDAVYRVTVRRAVIMVASLGSDIAATYRHGMSCVIFVRLNAADILRLVFNVRLNYSDFG